MIFTRATVGPTQTACQVAVMHKRSNTLIKTRRKVKKLRYQDRIRFKLLNQVLSSDYLRQVYSNCHQLTIMNHLLDKQTRQVD